MKLTDAQIKELDEIPAETLDDIILTLRAYAIVRKLNSKIRKTK